MSSSPLPLLGWTGESQHGEADVLRSVSSWEAGPYRSLPVREIVKGCGPTQIRVSITKKKVLWKKIFSIDKINSWHHFLVCVVCVSLLRCSDKTLSQIFSVWLFSYVCIAMEALDQLLMACHCQSINLFVESFLKMVRKLLESDKPSLQILGTNSVSKRS